MKNYGKCLQYCYCKHVSDETQGPTFVYGTQSVIVNFAIHGTNKSTVSTSNTIISYTLYEFDIWWHSLMTEHQSFFAKAVTKF